MQALPAEWTNVDPERAASEPTRGARAVARHASPLSGRRVVTEYDRRRFPAENHAAPQGATTTSRADVRPHRHVEVNGRVVWPWPVPTPRRPTALAT